MIDLIQLDAMVTKLVTKYESTAPTVSAWADDLYIRINEDRTTVTLEELVMAQRLIEMNDPNYAANTVYKLQERHGQPTTGHAGY